MTTPNSDCGCHDTPAPRALSSAPKPTSRSVYIPRDAVTEVLPPPVPQPDPGPAARTTALGGFRGLNPQDGLFLRGEHLGAIQDYSRALTSALALANGTGVVHGLGVQIADGKLVVYPGLAISPGGRMLLLNETVEILLDDPLPGLPPDGYWKIELHWAWATAGTAVAHGSLCTHGCNDGGSTIRPWRDEGVEIRIVTESMPGFDAIAEPRLRGNWLSSAYFERERNNAQPWLVPGVPDAAIPSLDSRTWEDGTTAPAERGVPLAIMHSAGRSATSGYRLQLWTARRLVDGAVAHATWRSRLAMRPWSVFLAQILQFESEVLDSLADLPGPQGAQIVDLGEAAQHLRTLQKVFEQGREFVGSVGNAQWRKTRAFAELATTIVDAEASSNARRSLRPGAEYLGLTELPPAGYLPINENAENAANDLLGVFGEKIDLRTRVLRADQIADEVTAAQHRDRIPLSPIGDLVPQVDVLLPREPADQAALSTPAYGWVAFVRRGPAARTALEETEEVPVYLVERGVDYVEDDGIVNLQDLVKAAESEMEDQEPVGVLSYPVDGWEYPGHSLAADVIELLSKGGMPTVVVALATGQDEAPLAATRAGLFLLSLDRGYRQVPVAADGGRRQDAIVIIRSPR